ncbi:unnamed protein product [Spirodela intermedia]|uniref:Uncharacterized protein n=1 Tax=Spirodela intermedia TaxID=51605 RepID=A0A7I8KNH3_SPIIN|nr:unnamed protein product [Spirodela intermedia]
MGRLSNIEHDKCLFTIVQNSLNQLPALSLDPCSSVYTCCCLSLSH